MFVWICICINEIQYLGANLEEIWMTSIWVCSLCKAIVWKNAVNSLVTLCLFSVEKGNLNLLLREKVIQEWNDMMVFMFYGFNSMTSIKYGIMRLKVGNEKIQFHQKNGEIRREERREEEKRRESDGATLVDLLLDWTFSLVQETTQGWSLGDELGRGATNLSRTRPSLIKTHLSNITSETPRPNLSPHNTCVS